VSYFADDLHDVELPQPAIQKAIEFFAGKQIFSVLINPNPSKCPVKVTFEQKNRNYNAPKDYGPMDLTDCYITMENGRGRGNLFHVLIKGFDFQDEHPQCSVITSNCSYLFIDE
jgi:hypothetical protein